MTFLTAVIATALTWAAVGALRRYAIRRQVLAIPDHRTSHETPTPRGGGAAVAAVTLAGFVIAERGGLDVPVILALIGVIPTAVVGWLDDHKSLPVAPRFAAHIVSGLLLLPLALQSWPRELWWIAGLGWMIAALSAINVVNFMDGIDAIIGLQALVFGLHLVVLGGVTSGAGTIGVLLAASSIGFLIWNWPKAKIFLGDVGSGALALIALVGGMLLLRETAGLVGILGTFMPLFPLFLDSTVTLIDRQRRGHRITSPHREHLYQRLANEAGLGHAKPALIFAAAAAAGSAAVALPSLEWRNLVGGMYVALVVFSGIVINRWARSKAARQPGLAKKVS